MHSEQNKVDPDFFKLVLLYVFKCVVLYTFCRQVDKSMCVYMYCLQQSVVESW